MSEPNETTGAAGQKRTVIEDGTHLKGALSSTCPILVQGKVEGEVDGPAVTVSASGSISGTVVAGTLKSAGSLAGEFDVDTAQVAGSVSPKTVIQASSVHFKLAATERKHELRFTRGGGGAT